jgi:hypothetical protein
LVPIDTGLSAELAGKKMCDLNVGPPG